MNLRDYNLDILEENVRTKYGDYGGLIQIDGHNGADLFKLCEDHGVDMDKYFLIAFGLGTFFSQAIMQQKEIYCRALVIDRSEYGNSFDEIKKTLSENGGAIKAKKIHFEVKTENILKYIKRMDFMVATKLTPYIDKFEIEETE